MNARDTSAVERDTTAAVATTAALRGVGTHEELAPALPSSDASGLDCASITSHKSRVRELVRKRRVQATGVSLQFERGQDRNSGYNSEDSEGETTAGPYSSHEKPRPGSALSLGHKSGPSAGCRQRGHSDQRHRHHTEFLQTKRGRMQLVAPSTRALPC